MNPQPFQHFIRRWYLAHGRHELPWRQTSDPYAILVSELMLQQTQVDRVIPKYQAFLQQFPTVKALSCAKLADVLVAWQGLGYNRRAKYLWQTARQINQRSGVFPSSVVELQQFPGIGPYTASAVACFSYNQPVTLIETNIRAVFLYHFFPEQENVSDKNILLLIEATIDTTNPREWYWALMDYGSYLKKITVNPSRRARQYTKQAPFAGSLRQARGEIIRLLSQSSTLNQDEIQQQMTANTQHLQPALQALTTEGMVREHAGQYSLAMDLG